MSRIIASRIIVADRFSPMSWLMMFAILEYYL